MDGEGVTGRPGLLTSPSALLGSKLSELSIGVLVLVVYTQMMSMGMGESWHCVTHANTGAQECVKGEREHA
jgi:hypothetical protein